MTRQKKNKKIYITTQLLSSLFRRVLMLQKILWWLTCAAGSYIIVHVVESQGDLGDIPVERHFVSQRPGNTPVHRCSSSSVVHFHSCGHIIFITQPRGKTEIIHCVSTCFLLILKLSTSASAQIFESPLKPMLTQSFLYIL